MNIRIATGLLVLAFFEPALAQETSVDFSWDGVPPCKTLSQSPRFTIRNFPKDAKTVMLQLTQGNRARGGQEVELPSSGQIPAGAATTMGPCNPDMYRWTAIFKAPNGQVVGQASAERRFP